jgi:putative hemolysin
LFIICFSFLIFCFLFFRMSISLELLIIFGLILANGFFAAAEVAVLTARRSRLEQQARSHQRAAEKALELASNPGRFLPAVQVGMTLITTLASAFGGVTLARPLSEWLAGVRFAPIAENPASVALGLVALGLTFATIVFGELIPKQLALRNAEAVARWVALPFAAFQVAARPAIWLMEVTSHLVLSLLGHGKAQEKAVSIEDIEHLIHTGTHQGLLDPAEQMLARRALRLGDRTVRDIMRPRIEIDALDVDTPPDEVIGAVAMAGFSRLPVHEGDLDHIIGFVYTKDLLLRQHMGWPIELRKLVRPALLVPESLRIDKLLESFRQKRVQMALVLDEFGGTEGLVTMEDVLEELVGEIHDEHRAERQQQIVARDDSSWYVDAGMPLHELLERMEMTDCRGSLPADVSTVGGLVLSKLGRIPVPGESVTWECFSFEVVAMDGPRLERVLIRRKD